MAVSVQRGTVVPNPGSGQTTTVTISPVDLSKSFLVYNWRSNQSGANKHRRQYMGWLSSPTQISFYLTGDPGTATICWEVVQDDDLLIQRGISSDGVNHTENITINPVSLQKRAWVTAHGWATNVGTGNYGARDFVAARLTSRNTLTLQCGNTVVFSARRWQVIESPYYRVLTVAVVNPSGATVDVSLGESFSLSSTFIALTGGVSNSNVGANTGGEIFVASMLSSTQARLVRGSSPTYNSATWYLQVVECPKYSVQRVSGSISSGTTINSTITSVTLARTFVLRAGLMEFNGGYTASSSSPVNGWFSGTLTSATNLRAERTATSGTATHGHWVVSILSTPPPELGSFLIC